MSYGKPSRARQFFGDLSAFERHQQQQRNRHRRRASTDVPPFSSVVNRENLLRVFKSLKANGGQAPGVDGLRYTDVSTTEIADVLQQVSSSIHADDYQPQPIRAVRIPKPRGGHRTLKLSSIVDRVVTSAVAEAIGPLFEERFNACSCSYGYRKWLNSWHMLAKIEWLATERGQTAIAVDDIRQAFDFVPIEPLLDLLRRQIADRQTQNLIERLMRGSEGNRHTVGIDQGNPLSPLMLNLLLDEYVDRRLTADASLSFLRYADNLVLMSSDLHHVRRSMETLTDLLQSIGLSLKGQDGPPVDLREPGTRREILGYQITWVDNRLQFEPGQQTWSNLAKALREAHLTSSPTQSARLVLGGWLEANVGPLATSAEVGPIVEQAIRAAAQSGHLELGPSLDLRNRANASLTRWRDICAQVRTARCA